MKQQWTKRLFAGIAALALALPIAFGLGQNTVHADETDPATQTVVLTKYGFSTEQQVGSHDTNQTPDQVTGDNGWAKDATPLEGVQFQVYDVTSAYWADPNAYPNEKGVTPKTDDGTLVTVEGQSTFTTDTQGQITWQLPTLSTDAAGTKHNAVYVFHEVQSRTGYQATSEDFMLSLPTADGATSTAYVYPKNQKADTFKRYFHKIDGETSNDLAGAKFVIKKGDQYLQLKNADGTVWTPTAEKDKAGFIDTENLNLRFAWVDSQADATKFTSDANGEFGLNGFDDTKTQYTAVETEAPAGYDEATADFAATDTDDPVVIKDTPTHLLPHTGGAGILAILAVGAALLAVAFVGIRKRQARA